MSISTSSAVFRSASPPISLPTACSRSSTASTRSTDLDDDEGFARSCQQGLELGFDGKTLIHPKTIAAANRVFAPSAEEIDWSRRIIRAHADAVAEGRGIVVVDGKLVENLHVLNARRVVDLAESIVELERAAAAS